ISKELKCALIDEYTNERKLDDGEFYYKIREFQGVFGSKNPYFESRWWARLAATTESTNRKERLKQLLNHPQFGPAFDKFRAIPALYGGLRLSVINKMICMKCHDLLLFHLDEIKKFYYSVFHDNENAMKRLTRADVEGLHLTAPGACQADAQALYGRIKAGELLGAFNGHERDAIWSKLCSETTNCLVPSLFAFFENLKYLNGPADCMKRLIRPRHEETIFSALENAFIESRLPAGRCPIQVSRTTFRFARVNAADRLDLLYRQLWLMAFREYRDMPRKSKKKLAGPREGEADETILFEFASLADKFGIHTEEILELVQKDPDREMIRRFLRTVRKPDQYRYENLEDCITQVIGVINGAEPLRENDNGMNLEVDEDEKPPNRCGVPNDADQLRDKSSMFLNRLHGPIEGQDISVTSFFIQRSCYFYFFGKNLPVNLDDLEDLPEETEFNPVHCLQAQRDLGQPMDTLETNQAHDQQEQQQLHLEQQHRQEIQQLDTTLQSLTTKQHEQQEILKNLEKKLPEKAEYLENIANKAQDIENRIQQLKDKEAEHSRRVDQLKTEEAGHQHTIKQLEKSQGILENKIRINSLATESLAAEEKKLQSSIRELATNEREQQKRMNNQQQLERLPQEATTEHSDQGTTGQSTVGTSDSGKVYVKFKHRAWVTAHELLVDPLEPSEVQRVATKYLRKRVGIFDHNFRTLTPRNCFERITSDGTYTIYLRPEWEVETMYQPPKVMSGLEPDDQREVIPVTVDSRRQNPKRHKDKQKHVMNI
ncbi:hypothetical protein B0T10DRAFT_410683, partial [Thelonectria olida]